MTSSSPPWWRSAVIYQVYPRSFADSDGDGVGDLDGLRARLDHVRDLGVDAIWLNPFYPSPQMDAGYDVSNYCDVDPVFGTLADFGALVDAAHARDLKVVVDLVPNHTSDRHPWFQQALADRPGGPMRGRYLFRDGRGADGAQPPNNWQSVFGDAAWTRTTGPDGRPGQWYLHLFDPGQPDLDWTNDDVVEEFDSILRFWLARGVDGFRIDVAHGLAKDPQMPDLSSRHLLDPEERLDHPHWDRDEVHDVYRRWRRIVDEADPDVDRMLVGEVYMNELDRLARYVRPDELHTVFNFAFLLADFDASAMRSVIDESIATIGGVGAPTTWVLSNHDKTRHVTRYGGGEIGVRRARAAALLMLALPGGAYVYQGDELGLPDVVDLPDEVRQDPAFGRAGGEGGTRDGCRVPIPWSGDEPSFGFGPGSESWLPQPAEWAALSVERQCDDPGSMLTLYRRALRMRRDLDALGDGVLEWIDSADGTLVFGRPPGFVCAVNLSDNESPLPDEGAGWTVKLSSLTAAEERARHPTALPPASALWLVSP